MISAVIVEKTRAVSIYLNVNLNTLVLPKSAYLYKKNVLPIIISAKLKIKLKQIPVFLIYSESYIVKKVTLFI